MIIPALNAVLSEDDPMTTDCYNFQFYKFKNVQKNRSVKEFELNSKLNTTTPVKIFKGKDLKSKEPVILMIQKASNVVKALKSNVKELEILRHVEHSSILKFFDVVQGENLAEFYYVFEHCDFHLSELLNNSGWKDLTLIPFIKSIMSQLFSGLHYLHEGSIAHRDIHPDNLLLFKNGSLKIMNFKNARFVDDTDRRIVTAEYRYQPLDQLIQAEVCSKAIDIWSATCIFVQLFTGKHVFADKKEEKCGREICISKIFSVMGYPSTTVWKEFSDISKRKYLQVEGIHGKCNILKELEKVPDKAVPLILGGLRYNPKHRYQAKDFLKGAYFCDEDNAPNVEIDNLTSQMSVTNLSRSLH